MYTDYLTTTIECETNPFSTTLEIFRTMSRFLLVHFLSFTLNKELEVLLTLSLGLDRLKWQRWRLE